MSNVYKVLVLKLQNKRPLGRRRRRWEVIRLKMSALCSTLKFQRRSSRHITDVDVSRVTKGITNTGIQGHCCNYVIRGHCYSMEQKVTSVHIVAIACSNSDLRSWGLTSS
jgi:hypothetical protein